MWEHVRQFIHGLSLPFHLARALRTDARAWRRYLTVALVQCLVIVSVSALLKRSAHEAVDSDRAELWQVQFWAALFATMQLIQWVVIALSRDYHDAISRDASLLTAIEPEDGPRAPRIRVDLKWMGKKFARRVRAFVVFLAGLPVLLLFTVPLPYGGKLMSMLVSLWSAYWLVVFTTSKTAHAWDDTSGRAPWFLRGWTWLTTTVPGFRWGFLQSYGRFWENRTRSVYSPAVELEKQPWAFAGLAVIRVLSVVPLVKCFLRPLIPVAAAHLVLAQRASAPTELPAPAAVASSRAA